MKGVIFVGWINRGKVADCGETMKNQLIINKLEEFGIKCRQMDFKGWRKHPWVILQLIWNMVVHKNDTLILSTSVQNIYPFMRLMKKIKWKQNTVHWVIGGSLGQKIQQGIYQADVINYMNHTLVESRLMVEQLKSSNIEGVREVPNFKPIFYTPIIGKKYPDTKKPLRFIFLSRIMPEKGCDYILEASRLLNEDGYGNKYIIDFFGKIADGYKSIYLHKIKLLENVNYRGFLDLKKNTGYDELATYDLMLFPTYWRGEGFAGIFIDAFISGLPIIASKWAHNDIFLDEYETSLFIPVHNVIALHDKMKECIEGLYNITDMAKKCQKKAKEYHIDNIITKELLIEIGVI